MHQHRDVFDEMLEAFPYPKVLRSKVSDFSFGLISGKRLNNIASAEGGTPAPLKIGNRVMYDANELADWLRKKYS